MKALESASWSESQFARFLACLVRGEDSAVRRFVNVFGPLVRRAVRRHLDPRLRARFDSADFVQGVWASVFRRPTCLERLKHAGEARQFLARVARNKVLDAARRAVLAQKRDVRVECDLENLAGTPHTSPDFADQRQARPSELARAHEEWHRLVASQPSRFREIPVLRCLGNTFEEIASTMGLHERTVRRVMARLAASLDQ